MKNGFKIIFINFLIFFFLIGVLVLSPILIYQIYQTVQPNKNIPHQASFLNEFENLKSKYTDTITYQYQEFKGDLINIDKDGNRETKLGKNIDKNLPTHIFFGSSVIWGYGESDEKTVPSIFSLKNNILSENFAVNAYSSRQSLAKLINYYITDRSSKSKVIIFNDGAMDILQYITHKDDDFPTWFSDKIREALLVTTNNTSPLNFNYLLKPISTLLKEFNQNISDQAVINSSDNPSFLEKRTDFAINSIIKSWLLASRLAKANGDLFFAVLTPISYENEIKVSTQFPISDEEKIATIKGYKILREKIKNYSEINFIDLSRIFDTPENYLDNMHYSYQGKVKYVNDLTNHMNTISNFKDLDK